MGDYEILQGLSLVYTIHMCTYIISICMHTHTLTELLCFVHCISSDELLLPVLTLSYRVQNDFHLLLQLTNLVGE